MNSYKYSFNSDIGGVTLEELNERIVKISLDFKNHSKGDEECPTELLKNAANQIIEYTSGARKDLTFPTSILSTDFRKKVYEEVRNIPRGEIRTYSDIAKAVGSPKASLCVGTTLKNNNLALYIPCHRVVNSKMCIDVYFGQDGDAVDIRKKLLEVEGVDTAKLKFEKSRKPCKKQMERQTKAVSKKMD